MGKSPRSSSSSSSSRVRLPSFAEAFPGYSGYAGYDGYIEFMTKPDPEPSQLPLRRPSPSNTSPASSSPREWSPAFSDSTYSEPLSPDSERRCSLHTITYRGSLPDLTSSASGSFTRLPSTPPPATPDISPTQATAAQSFIILRPQMQSGSLEVAAHSEDSLSQAVQYLRRPYLDLRYQPRRGASMQREEVAEMSDAEMQRRRHWQEAFNKSHPYACKVKGCDRRYTSSSNLRRHLRLIHLRGQAQSSAVEKRSSPPLSHSSLAASIHSDTSISSMTVRTASPSP
ncbi:hypothetical protein AURDEDRAFT_171819 [Auricularia subglabra TFB-10046 SS5]|uniref:C2H2-type domain-containing protein n=1 Tax=Auricularia subglabra (strain TFB-10046 / SS5) TaxID=717982 RepID=J0LIH6_AURST|nr:hypothetical protein AURDEDRAFT_171819 [Auricularia subglabra TFB-10046 SS5]